MAGTWLERQLAGECRGSPAPAQAAGRARGSRGFGICGNALVAYQQVAPKPEGKSLGWPLRWQAEFLGSLQHFTVSVLSCPGCTRVYPTSNQPDWVHPDIGENCATSFPV